VLTIIVTKLLLKGAIKTFIVKPILTSTMTILPEAEVIQASMLDYHLLISAGDLLKFSAEKLYERFVGKKLDFQIQKLTKYIYGITPADEFAALFSKEYSDDQELIIDLTKFEKYLDSLYAGLDFGDQVIDSEEVDDLLNSTIEDLDLAINLSHEDMFDDIDDEQKLVDQILQKNIEEVNIQSSQKIAKNDLSDFPTIPSKVKSDEEEINEILSNFLPKPPKKKQLSI
jgi:hypothetical protein